ncbi:preprotein translocase subunit YajC [Microbacterium terricola]|uniref:Preprotein translocase subunit YajC n=1 Tax=Microbacterium terricola TaxID=344163 RepID=A0ABM8DYL6_9MICO|nr:preprotein translocase subunit YajC [Microbacterium terricola]UYK38702.1 preprotein translocase subunit YajC [Microbacterium terricola]BDV30610.1 preprotein translocase subunit YajC [Microbacterium terricola]
MADWILPGLLVVLLVFMFWSSRRRMAKQKLEQEEKANQTVPGAEVLLQGGLYGTIVSFDPENLDQPAIVELAPGVEIKVHSQAILRVVTPTVVEEGADAPEIETISETDAPEIETIEETRARLDDESTPDTDPGTKPQA